MRAPVHSARIAARLTASIATTAGREARCARGSVRPAGRMRVSRRSMIELVSACSEMRLPVWRDHLERFEHRAGRGRGNLAEGVAHIELEADHAAVDQRGNVLDRVLAEHGVEAVIDVRLLGRHLVLGGERFRRADGRDRVRHVEHGGDAAEGRRDRAAREVLLLRIAGIAEMHMHVDRAGQHVHAGDVDCLARWRHCVRAADAENLSVLDGDGRLDHGVGRDDLAALEDQVGAVIARPIRRRPECPRR